MKASGWNEMVLIRTVGVGFMYVLLSTLWMCTGDIVLQRGIYVNVYSDYFDILPIS